ncbi:MAG: DUF5703 domain-containing protein [Luteolibacter sp.]|uniref:DUF5703 domain-containing protein n=1 Tax=Luteolibacter sp. TaxID=1962973 RepID=UPI003264091C
MMRLPTTLKFLLLLPACLATLAKADDWDPLAETARQDVVWTSHGTGEADNMPLGNGRTGATVWVEPGGNLKVCLSHNDAVSELHRLLKLGKLDIAFDPSPFGKDEPFQQHLVLRGARVEISAGAPGKELKLQMWIDSDLDVLNLTGTSGIPRNMTVTLENWRLQKRELAGDELASTWNYRTGLKNGVQGWESADVIRPHEKGLLWFHRNAYSSLPAHYEAQGLGSLTGKFRDPLENRTSGVLLAGQRMAGKPGNVLSSTAPLVNFDLRAAVNVSQTQTEGEWEKQVVKTLTSSRPPAESRERTTRWWEDYWRRSWLFVEEPSKPIIPQIKHALKFGRDQTGANRLPGKITGLVTTPSALPAEEIAKLAASPVTGGQEAADLSLAETVDLTAKDFTVAAWIAPGPQEGRIFDSITPGGTDGMLFDTHQGLRFIFGNQTLQTTAAWKEGEWHHVACVVSSIGGFVRIYLDGKEVMSWKAPEAENPSPVTRAYVLAKMLTAMQVRGETPAHFQGGIFTVDPSIAFYATNPATFPHTPDYRFYGCSYWWQNVRFIYLPLLAQGWHEPVRKFIDFYASKADLFAARAKKYYGAEGVYFQETVNLAGLPGMGDFGWGASEYSESYTSNIWQQALELSVLMQDYYEHTQDAGFLRDTLIPWSNEALRFYDTRFKKIDGKIRVEPTHAVETYWTGVADDMPSVAGLHAVTSWLLDLPEKDASPADRAYWQRIASQLPALPKRQVNGVTLPDNAAVYDKKRSNYESPDLYGVFPFRVYGLGRDEHPIAEAVEAWKQMPNPGHVCWYQTGVIAARLGLADEAKQDVVLRAENRMKRSDRPGTFMRFPGYLGSPHDWCPDFDGPGNMMNTLQEMIIQQGPNGSILLVPAWPKDWNAKFRLFASGNTVVEGVIRQGKLESWKTTPESARSKVRVQESN